MSDDESLYRTSLELANVISKTYFKQSKDNNSKVKTKKSSQKLSESELSKLFYSSLSSKKLVSNQPWKEDVNYFETAYISSLALLKMTMHARSGGSIEIMGMMTGKIFENSIVVMDCYPLPVEGTETRVNAQSEGYEFMVQYLDNLKKLNRFENIVGWYHSHPGYGCWLSGIDVATQSLNQQFQDPYLAVVIDPERTMANKRVEIGAFRTYPENSNNNANNDNDKNNNRSGDNGGINPKVARRGSVPLSKLNDFGVHHDRYYSLDVKFFKSDIDSKFMSNLYDNKYWSSELLNKETNEMYEKEVEAILDISAKLDNYKIPKMNNGNNNTNENIDDKTVLNSNRDILAVSERNSYSLGSPSSTGRKLITGSHGETTPEMTQNQISVEHKGKHKNVKKISNIAWSLLSSNNARNTESLGLNSAEITESDNDSDQIMIDENSDEKEDIDSSDIEIAEEGHKSKSPASRHEIVGKSNLETPGDIVSGDKSAAMRKKILKQDPIKKKISNNSKLRNEVASLQELFDTVKPPTVENIVKESCKLLSENLNKLMLLQMQQDLFSDD